MIAFIYILIIFSAFPVQVCHLSLYQSWWLQNIQQCGACTECSPIPLKASFCDGLFNFEALWKCIRYTDIQVDSRLQGWMKHSPIGGDPISVGETNMGKSVTLWLWGVMRIMYIKGDQLQRKVLLGYRVSRVFKWQGDLRSFALWMPLLSQLQFFVNIYSETFSSCCCAIFVKGVGGQRREGN